MRVAPLFFVFTAVLAAACGPDAKEADQSVAMDKVGNAIGYPSSGGDAFGRGSAAGAVATRAAVRVEEAAPAPPAAPYPGAPEEQMPSASQSIASSMVIRTGDARVEVDSLEIAIARLHEMARQMGGFIGNTSMQSGERELRQATVEMKVPSDRFDAARDGLSSLGKVEYVTVNAQDVGEEFVDVTARAENARRLEQRLIALLASRTGKLEEVLSVERELARVRETIERYEGRLRYLRTRVAVSTLSVTVPEKEPLVGELGSGNRIVDAFRNAWRNFVGFLAMLIESLGVLIPLAVLALVAWWVWRKMPRRPGPPAGTAEG